MNDNDRAVAALRQFRDQMQEIGELTRRETAALRRRVDELAATVGGRSGELNRYGYRAAEWRQLERIAAALRAETNTPITAGDIAAMKETIRTKRPSRPPFDPWILTPEQIKQAARKIGVICGALAGTPQGRAFNREQAIRRVLERDSRVRSSR